MNNSDIFKITSRLIGFSPRQGENEIKAYKYLVGEIKEAGLKFIDQEFETIVPITTKSKLIADKKIIESRGVGLKGGKWEGKENLISSLLAYDDIYYIENNLNFNPLCEKTISTPSYFSGAAIAFNKKDLPKILRAKTVTAETVVTKYKYKSHNLILGNTENPTNIVFTHYDSLERGAIDNASGTAITLSTVLQFPETLANNLFVIAGNEELSYEMPIYWGKGYRVFEQKYTNLLAKAKKILVVDSIGHTKATWQDDPGLTIQAIPFKAFDKLSTKISVLASDIGELMNFYHSDADDLEKIHKPFLRDAQEQLLKALD